MKEHMKHLESERGIALIVVLLLMLVLSGLATGFAMTGQVEAQMAQNEINYAGARAAAEAGLNRALVEMFNDSTTNWILGPDGLSSATPTATENADNGTLSHRMGTGPFYVDSNNRFSYEVQVLDDDNTLLYESGVTFNLASMNENGRDYEDQNSTVVLRATGYGPNGTVVRLSRLIDTNPSTAMSTTTSTVLSNPAILINGDFEMNGNITIQGTSGTVHANGNLSKTGDSGTITGDATASGSYSGPVITGTGHVTGGGRPTINVPEIRAEDYESLATYKLTVVGGSPVVQTKATPTSPWATCTTSACTGTGWSYSGGTWSTSSNPTNAVYYVEGNVDIGNTSGSTNRPITVIATGDINVQGGSAELTPATGSNNIQFVSNGDVEIVNGADLDATSTLIEGQILVRGQFEAGGNMEFQGRVMVQDVDGIGNLVADGANRIHGSVRFTYNGSLSSLSTTTTITTAGATTYVNNVMGWMEQ